MYSLIHVGLIEFLKLPFLLRCHHGFVSVPGSVAFCLSESLFVSVSVYLSTYPFLFFLLICVCLSLSVSVCLCLPVSVSLVARSQPTVSTCVSHKTKLFCSEPSSKLYKGQYSGRLCDSSIDSSALLGRQQGLL